VPKRSFNQPCCIKINHVVQSVSTLTDMTRQRALWLQI
jgi:hypothetical protein